MRLVLLFFSVTHILLAESKKANVVVEHEGTKCEDKTSCRSATLVNSCGKCRRGERCNKKGDVSICVRSQLTCRKLCKSKHAKCKTVKNRLKCIKCGPGKVLVRGRCKRRSWAKWAR